MSESTKLAINIGGEDISVECTIDEAKSLEAAAELVRTTLLTAGNQPGTASKLLLTSLSLARQVTELKLYKERTENVLRAFNTRLSSLLEKYPNAAQQEVESSVS